MNATDRPSDSQNLTTTPLDTSPLTHPLKRLEDDLNALVENGNLQGIELDLSHADCPCFLLNVAPEMAQFYIELFLEDTFEPLQDDQREDAQMDDDQKDDEGQSLCVLMNWIGNDTELAFWQTEWGQTEWGGSAQYFGEVLSLILCMTADRRKPEIREMENKQ